MVPGVAVIINECVCMCVAFVFYAMSKFLFPFPFSFNSTVGDGSKIFLFPLGYK